MRVEFLPRAKSDLDGISEPLLGRVQKRLQALGQFPELGSQMGDAYAEYRSTVIENYRIVYRLRPDDAVEITFIRDCRRRSSKRLSTPP